MNEYHEYKEAINKALQVVVLKRYDNDNEGIWAAHTLTFPDVEDEQGWETGRNLGFLTYPTNFMHHLEIDSGFTRCEFSEIGEDMAHYIVRNILPIEWHRNPEAWKRVTVFTK